MTGWLSSRLLARPQDRLGLDLDLDLLADHDAARHRRVEGDPELAPVDLPAGRETGPGAAEGIRAEPVDLEREGDRAGHPADGQLTIEDEVVAILADAGGVVGHLRVGGGVEEVREAGRARARWRIPSEWSWGEWAVAGGGSRRAGAGPERGAGRCCEGRYRPRRR